MKCRSEPQVVESRTCRIASCGLTIRASSMVSTPRSLIPFKHSAVILASSNLVAAAGSRGGVVL
jgi:hypothetical protein